MVRIVPVDTPDGVITTDEAVRRDTTVAALAGLKPAFKPDGRVTAGNSSQISDGAAAMLIMGEDVAEKMGLTPLARFHRFVSPRRGGSGDHADRPIPATFRVLEKSGLGVDDIGLLR